MFLPNVSTCWSQIDLLGLFLKSIYKLSSTIIHMIVFFSLLSQTSPVPSFIHIVLIVLFLEKCDIICSFLIYGAFNWIQKSVYDHTNRDNKGLLWLSYFSYYTFLLELPKIHYLFWFPDVVILTNDSSWSCQLTILN